jgi:hypothetical protein
MKYDEDLNVRKIAVWVSIFAVMILAVIIATQGFFHSLKDEEVWKKNVLPISEELTKYTIEQEGRLNGFNWIDRNKGIVAIPIDTAMELTARELEEERTALKK